MFLASPAQTVIRDSQGQKIPRLLSAIRHGKTNNLIECFGVCNNLTMKTVWVSRPPARAACLIAALEKHHLRGWHYPAFIIADLEKNDALVQFAEAVENYHAIIFITAEAVLRCRHYLPPQKSSAAPIFPHRRRHAATNGIMQLCGGGSCGL